MAIIAISGKKSSGKDTIGKMIQYLTTKTKHSYNFSDWINPEINYALEDILKKDDWKVKKFADKLKEICALLTGTKRENFESEEFKNKELPKEWDYVFNGDTKPVHIDTFKGDNVFDANPERWIKHRTYRELLQKIGTEAMRDTIHQDVWCNALFSDYKDNGKFINEEVTASDGGYYNKRVWQENLPNWIITDLRFENELKAVKDREGLIIRVNRDKDISNFEKAIASQVDEHPSETSLDNYPFEIVIDNNGSIEELFEKVKEILIKNEII